MRFLLVLALITMTGPVLADHPGERLDEVMTKNEPAFEVTDLYRIPHDEFRKADGEEFLLSDMKDTVIILRFKPVSCGPACDHQQALLIKVQEAIDITPMRDMVNFITVTPDDTAKEKKEGAFTSLSKRDTTTLPMVHVIDRGGRHAGIFHGTEFSYLNMLLYINGLTNAHPHEPSIFKRMLSVFK